MTAPPPTEPADDRVETVARVLHGRRHRAGHAHTCDRCRADARVAVAALTADAAPPGTR